MDPLADLDLRTIIIMALFFGVWIVRAVYQSLVKPARRPPHPPGRPAGPPAKGLREFLEEIRQDEVRGGKPAAAPAPAARREELEWEEVPEEEVVVALDSASAWMRRPK